MQQVELSVSFVLRATCSDVRDTLPHDIAHAIVCPATDTTPCDRPDGHRHGQTTVRGPAPLPPRAGGSFDPPAQPS